MDVRNPLHPEKCWGLAGTCGPCICQWSRKGQGRGFGSKMQSDRQDSKIKHLLQNFSRMTCSSMAKSTPMRTQVPRAAVKELQEGQIHMAGTSRREKMRSTHFHEATEEWGWWTWDALALNWHVDWTDVRDTLVTGHSLYRRIRLSCGWKERGYKLQAKRSCEII